MSGLSYANCIQFFSLFSFSLSRTKPLNNNNNNGNGKSAQSKPKIQPKYSIHRDVLTHELVIKDTGYEARDKSIPSSLRNCWQGWNFFALFTGVIPILQWLPQYSLRRDLIGDIIAGFTVAIMNIPHGMAYGILAGVSAGNGLYMAVFPVLIYMLLGTSKHISIGTFAVASMMTHKVVMTYANEPTAMANITTTTTTTTAVPSLTLDTAVTTTANPLALVNATLSPPCGTSDNVITNLEVVTSLALTVGIMNVSWELYKKKNHSII